MAEPPDDLKELRLKIVELENQLREFIDPPELSEDEIKAYKKVKAAVEFGARGCIACVAAMPACSRACYMSDPSAMACGGRGCYVAEPSAAGCGGRGCYMSDVAAAGCGRSCYMSDPSAYGCSRACYLAEPSAMACRGCGGCIMSDPSAMACRGCGGCIMSDPSAMACGGRGCSGPCIAGHGTPGPRLGRGAVGRFAGLAD